MDAEASFGTVMEFSVALAGFSAVAIALSNERGELEPLDRFRTLTILSHSLGPAFGASLVLVGSAFGANGPILWQLTSAGVLVVAVVCLVVPLRLQLRLSPVNRRQLSSWLWVLSVGGTSTIVVVQVMNIVGLFGDSGPGPIMASLIWLLAFSAILFVRMIVNRPSPRAAEGDDEDRPEVSS